MPVNGNSAASNCAVPAPFFMTASTKRGKSLRSLVARDGPYCWICGLCCDIRPIDHNADGRVNRIMATRDHVIPVFLGGTNHLRNLRLAHKYCNSKRGCKIVSVGFSCNMRRWYKEHCWLSLIDEAEKHYKAHVEKTLRMPQEIRERLCSEKLPPEIVWAHV